MYNDIDLPLVMDTLGIWKLQDWTIETAIKQLNREESKLGVYVLINTVNYKLLIGEGKISGRCNRIYKHINGHNEKNKKFLSDLKKYGKNSFRLYGIIPEKDEIKRALIENKLQVNLKNICYNRPRRHYPTQKEIVEYEHRNQPIKDRINNYTKIQRINGFDECWESNYSDKKEYSSVYMNNTTYPHHILMYILHYGDICGITSTIDHLCNNKKCVNPKHLKMTTNSKNCRRYYNSDIDKKKICLLYNKGFTIKDISEKLKICTAKVQYSLNLKSNFSSQYHGVRYNPKEKAYIPFCQSVLLGWYKSEVEAAENRDYYIFKMNLLHKHTLNFVNIDYRNFIPHSFENGKINKNLI